MFKIFNFYFFLYSFTTRKKYLQEKFRTKKEKLSRVKTWARKHEGKLSTYKGFYIPINLPQTEQAKFFQKKWDEDEQKLRDKNLKTKKDKSTLNFYDADFEIESTLQNLQFLKLKTYKYKENNLTINKNILNIPNFKFNYEKIKNNLEEKTILFWRQKNSNFWIKFSKKFLKSPIFSIKIIKNQHIWSYFNIGFETYEFLNFFFIHFFPSFLVKFNFYKNKILIIKKFKDIFTRDSSSLTKFSNYKTIILNNLKILFTNKMLFIKKKNINQLFYFFWIYNLWQNKLIKISFYKNLLIALLINFSNFTLTGKLLQNLSVIIKTFFQTKIEIKLFLTDILMSRLQGTLDFKIEKLKNWKKLYYNSIYILSSNSVLNKNFLKFCYDQQNFKFLLNYKINLIGNFIFFFENIYCNYEIFFHTYNLIQKTNFFSFLENFSNVGKNLDKDFFYLSRNLTKTFFTFFKNRIKHYEQIRFLFYTSFSHQAKILNEFNVADVLFRFIIWKGKKLTAWRVFLKFLKKFKKWYSLPPLLIFTHALLMVEPKIWIKEKKIAGRQYDIPIYISSNRSKRIAIRWLLQAAKKWKWASITESLSQEVWDACFKKGGAFSNKENLHIIIKRNKSYMWWL